MLRQDAGRRVQPARAHSASLRLDHRPDRAPECQNGGIRCSVSTSVKLECSTLRCVIWTGHCPPSAALSVPSALGPGNARQCSRQGACQKPGSGPVYRLTLDGRIESRYQYSPGSK